MSPRREHGRPWRVIAMVVGIAMLLPASALAWSHAQRWVTDNWFLVTYPPTDSDESCVGAHSEPRPPSVTAAVICRHYPSGRTVSYDRHRDRASTERRFARLVQRYPNAQAACRRFGAPPSYLGSVPVACIKDFNELTIIWIDPDNHVYAKVHRVGFRRPPPLELVAGARRRESAVKIRVLQQIDLGVYHVTVESDRSVRLMPEDGPCNAPSVEVDALMEVPGGPLDGFYRVAESRDDGSVVIRRETSGQVVETILATSLDDEDLLDAKLARLAALGREGL